MDGWIVESFSGGVRGGRSPLPLPPQAGLHHDPPREVRADGDARVADAEDDVAALGGDDGDDGADDETELLEVLADLVVARDLLDLLFFAGCGEREGKHGKERG